MRIGFIGAGKVGFTLGKYFTSKGVNVVGYYSQHIDDAREAAAFTQTNYFKDAETLIAACDTLFLTVPDTNIVQVWDEIKHYPISGKNICHCSGALSADIFADLQYYGAYGYSVHPIYAIHDKDTSFQMFSEAYFTVEGCDAHISQITMLIASLGNSVRIMKAENKALYHAASVMVSNLVIALAKTGSDLFAQCGFDAQFSEKAWNALFLGNVENICHSGVSKALTGPLERGDINTIRKHLACLNDKQREIYVTLSRSLLSVAQEKHPDRDYSLIETELK
ncbi:Rossmann-like and DUF2520 domain-containing protein [Pragia fontium]|uniref:Predicted oxidoreductase, contains short-chain dehydrogenase (SDR) and DUF2520 domains n=1 Tax=Pragia fontium DSM 5563 = ATCC 49100 TaxID=1122977 RepID=A0AAJ4WAL4_9GAMM|nr:Rossmann-like and DUF2520 domain-containing protein [Pragia fontium]SFC81398.1 Predicted oxidoreductase, contains short-chain dehydrogenase (SDR) and DUF2520 domains [Pragia fontium DSM 5563 = ATCC 49100]VEJ55534.1 Uncharacterized conserved protein [Pragia fontium]